MRKVSRLLIAAIAFSFVISGFDTSRAEQTDGAVNIKYMDWSDDQRQRVIPVKLYLPEKLNAPLPVAIFSHGLGGSREAASYLGNYWAEHGYIGVFIQHPGSDESFWRPSVETAMQGGSRPDRTQIIGKFKTTVANPMHAVNRAQDVHFVIDKLEALNANDPLLKGRLDLNEIAIAGHSYGSWTALTASGQRFAGDRSSGDPRIKAAIYLSPTPPRKGSDPAMVFGNIKIPGLHLTGTLDESPVNDTKASERRIAFDNITKSDQYLVILNDADHAVFGGGRKGTAGSKTQHEVIERTSTEFLDAYLKHDQKAKDWMLKTASTYIKPHGTYELKTASRL